MSLPPIILRDIGDEVPAATRVIYDAYLNALQQPSRTTPQRAVLRAARRCGVPRQRVLEVVREVNSEALPYILRWVFVKHAHTVEVLPAGRVWLSGHTPSKTPAEARLLAQRLLLAAAVAEALTNDPNCCRVELSN